MNKFSFFILILIAVVFEAGGDVLFKLSHMKDKTIFLIAGVVLYTIGTIIWALSLKYEFLSKAIAIFTIINLIAVICVGVFFFKEDMSIFSKIGIGLGVVAVALMQF